MISRAGQPDWVTNGLPFGLAPTVTNFPLTVTRDNAGTATITLDCQPQVGPDQDCALLLGPTPIALASAHRRPVHGDLHHDGSDPGTYPARLRVDGVDSLLVNAADVPPVYDQSQVVMINEPRTGRTPTTTTWPRPCTGCAWCCAATRTAGTCPGRPWSTSAEEPARTWPSRRARTAPRP